MAKKRINIEEELWAWINALTAIAGLQKELVRASQDMTFTDEWAWMEPFRQLVFGVWDTIAQTPPEARLEKAKELKEQAWTSILVVRERAKLLKEQSND